MNVLQILRGLSSDQGTKSIFKHPDGTMWNILELPDRNNASGFSCVLPGTYTCKWLWSEKHGRFLYHLMDCVFTGPDGKFTTNNIEFHIGTWAGDTKLGWKTDSLGCLLIGNSWGLLTPPEYEKPQLSILNSRVTLKAFHDKMNEQEFQVVISWAAA